MPENQSLSQEQKIWGAISYLWVLSIVALAARKKDEFIRFHANQGLLLFVVSVVCMIFFPFLWIINVLIALVAIVGIIKALKGEKWELPLIGGVAKSLGDWVVKTVKL